MLQTKEKLSYIPLDKLDPCPLNSNEMTEAVYDKVKANIKRSGKYPSLIVRHKQDSDRFEIIDGYHRCQILKELGYTEAKCEVWDIDDTQTKLLLVTLNRLKGTDDTQKRAKLLTELYDEFDHDKSILNLIPESERGLESLLKTIAQDVGEFDEDMERGMVEQKLMQAGVDDETAKHIADGYRAPSNSNAWVLKFVFKDTFEYNRAVEFFGKHGNKDKLLEVIEEYAKKKKGSRNISSS